MALRPIRMVEKPVDIDNFVRTVAGIRSRLHLYDPLAVGLAVDPSLARWQPARIAVGESGQTRRAAGAPNCRVAHDIDATRFLARLFDRLCRESS